MTTALLIIQIFISIALIGFVILQVRGGGMGGIFGFESSVFRTRRGLEKIIFRSTVVLAALFVIIALLIIRL